MKPLQRAEIIRHGVNDEQRKKLGVPEEADREVWMNDVYQVHVNRDQVTGVGLMTWLSIKRLDKEPIFDWREMQLIKNQLVGPECEGVQLFPAEKRLVDGANQFHMWCTQEPGHWFPFGFTDPRQVTSRAMVPGSKQRPLDPDHIPPDLKEMEARVEKQLRDAGIEPTDT